MAEQEFPPNCSYCDDKFRGLLSFGRDMLIVYNLKYVHNVSFTQSQDQSENVWCPEVVSLCG